MISSWARDHVDSLQVKEFTSFSDHCPLVLNLTLFEPFVARFQLPDFSDIPLGYKWDNSNSQKRFMAALNNSPEVVNNLNNIISSEYSSTLEGNKKLTEALTNCLHLAADASLKTKKIPKKLSRKKWFNHQCDISKRNLNRLANGLGNLPKNSSLRKEYLSRAISYKTKSINFSKT